MKMQTTKLALLAPLAFAAGAAMAEGQAVFPTPDAAADALVQALGTERADTARLQTLLGADWQAYVPTEGVDREDVDAFLAAYGKKHAIEKRDDGSALIAVGDASWTLPVPLVQGESGWRFDPKAGAAEIQARRIGANELAAIQSVLAYHDAQMEYALQDRDDDGVLEYAQKVLSTEGEHDGLYWSDDATGEISPLGPLFADASADADWHGYRFHVLKAQGPSAPGGAYDYMLGDNMSRGFALVGWPAEYGKTGVMSFMVSHDGQVFEKDLGPKGAAVAAAMKTFDPDSSWEDLAGDKTAEASATP